MMGQGLGPGFTIVATRRSVIFSLEGREFVLTFLGETSVASVALERSPVPRRRRQGFHDDRTRAGRSYSWCPFLSIDHRNQNVWRLPNGLVFSKSHKVRV